MSRFKRFHVGSIVLGVVTAVALAAAHATLLGSGEPDAVETGDHLPNREIHEPIGELHAEHLDQGVGVCEDPTCGLTAGGTICAACQLYREALLTLPTDRVEHQGSIIENGVILRVTSTDPETATLLWEVAVARNEILESVNRGQGVPLCAACRENVDTFSELRVIVQRIPMGVLQVYTSSSPEMVRLLQTMLLTNQEPPL